MKIGIVGKGGAGKTTVSALLAKAFADRGLRVLAIDTDSNPNLGLSLGLSLSDTEAIPVIPRNLVVGEGGAMTADDLLAEYGRTTPAGVELLSAMRVTQARAGCTCSGHASVRSLLGTAIEQRADVTIVDMEAGLEHLSRSGGTLAYADALVVVVEPTRKAVVTAARTKELADELGIPRTVAVANKVRDQRDEQFVREECAGVGVEVIGTFPYSEDQAESERAADVTARPAPDGLAAATERVADALLGAVPPG